MTDQIIRLTEAKNNQASLVLFPKKVSASKGLSVSFDFYVYGGTGGDGFSFILLDAAKGVPAKAGAFGGSLGYANRFDDPGIKGGYLGVGFDEFGNYSEPGEKERVGGPGYTPNAIAVRGSEENKYRYLVGTESLPFDLAAGKDATQAEAKRTALVEISPEGLLSISVDANQNGIFTDAGEEVISDYDVAASSNGAIPDKFLFGFAGSTGAETNVHEVGNFEVKNSKGKTLSGDFTEYLIFGTDGDDNLTGSDNGDTIQALTGKDTVRAGAGDDIITAGLDKDKVLGQDGNDVIIQTGGPDIMTGGADADTFVFSDKKVKKALRTSTISSRARIKDFNQGEGDRVQLDFDRDYTSTGSSERPGSLYNVGVVGERNLSKALTAVYADIKPATKKQNSLKEGHAALFKVRKKWFLTINDNRAGFSAKNDAVIDMGKLTESDFASPGDFDGGKLKVTDYFM